MSAPATPDLPYTDTKPQGSADFYYATNATFRFLLRRLGADGWRRYLGDLGRGYFAPDNRQWQQGGLTAVARYWRAGAKDVRLLPHWRPPGARLDRYDKATDPDGKRPPA